MWLKTGIHVLFCCVLLCSSCADESTPDIPDVISRHERPDSSFYDLTLSSESDNSYQLSLKGEGVKASWDDDQGLIWLSTDENGSDLYGTLTLTVIPDSLDFHEFWPVTSAWVSLSDKLQGQNSNARLYGLDPNTNSTVTPYIVDNALIYGHLKLDLVLINEGSGGNPEKITAKGLFCAID